MTEVRQKWISRREMTLDGLKVVPGQIVPRQVGSGGMDKYRGERRNFYVREFVGDPADLLKCEECGEHAECFVSEASLEHHRQLVHQAPDKAKPEPDPFWIPPARNWKGTPEQEAIFDGWRADVIDAENDYRQSMNERDTTRDKQAEALAALTEHRRTGDPFSEAYYAKEKALDYAVKQATEELATAERNVKQMKDLVEGLGYGNPFAKVAGAPHMVTRGRNRR